MNRTHRLLSVGIVILIGVIEIANVLLELALELNTRIFIAIIIIILIAIHTGLQIHAGREEKEALNDSKREVKRAAIEQLLYLALPGLNPKTRRCVFVPSPDGKFMQFFSSWGSFQPCEVKLQFARGCGAVGRCWYTGGTVLARLEGLSVKEIRDLWMISKEQVKCTKRVKSIVAFPIKDQRDKVIGVLALDDFRDVIDTEIKDFLTKNGIVIDEVVEALSQVLKA